MSDPAKGPLVEPTKKTESNAAEPAPVSPALKDLVESTVREALARLKEEGFGGGEGGSWSEGRLPKPVIEWPDGSETWPAWARAFAEAYAETGIVGVSAARAGVARKRPWELGEKDQAFKDLIEQLKLDVRDRAPELVRLAAEEGFAEPIVLRAPGKDGGQYIAGWKKRPDPRMLELWAKAMQPAMFRERVDHSGQTTVVVANPEKLTREEWDSLVRQLDAGRAATAPAAESALSGETA